jgi:hypothetical protein
MSDPRYADPWNDPRRLRPRYPDGPRRLNLEEDSRRGDSLWAWIASIIAVTVVLMLAYDVKGVISSKIKNPTASTASGNVGVVMAPVQRANSTAALLEH